MRDGSRRSSPAGRGGARSAVGSAYRRLFETSIWLHAQPHRPFWLEGGEQGLRCSGYEHKGTNSRWNR